MYHQLNPSIPVICPLGKGRAISRTDPGEQHNVIWEIVLDKTGQIWSFQNPLVRVQACITSGQECEWAIDICGNVIERESRRILYRLDKR